MWNQILEDAIVGKLIATLIEKVSALKSVIKMVAGCLSTQGKTTVTNPKTDISTGYAYSLATAPTSSWTTPPILRRPSSLLMCSLLNFLTENNPYGPASIRQ